MQHVTKVKGKLWQGHLSTAASDHCDLEAIRLVCCGKIEEAVAVEDALEVESGVVR